MVNIYGNNPNNPLSKYVPTVFYGPISAMAGVWDNTGRLTSGGGGSYSNLSAIPGQITIPQISATGTPNSFTYLRGDGTWYTPAGGAIQQGNLSATTSSVITITNGTNSVIGNGVGITIIQSTSSTNGYISSGDWSTFNSKASTASLSAYMLKSTSGSFVTSGSLSAYMPYSTSGSFATSGSLSAYEPIVAIGTSAQWYRGDKTWSSIVVSSISATGTPSSATYLRGDGTWTSASSNGTSVTTENVTSTVSAGAIITGQVITSGTSLTDFVKSLLLKTFYPTFVAPTNALASSLAASVESGTTGNVTLTDAFVRGQIVGKTNAGIWEPATFQDYRAGIVTKYVINGVDMGTSASSVVIAYQVVDNSNTWSSSATYAQGPQPVDSLGANYNTPLTSGTIAASVTVTGKRKVFYGTDSSSSTPYTTTSQIRAISNNVLGPVNGTTFTINIPIGALMVVFAYPATLRDVNSVKYLEGLNAEVSSIFTKTLINVEGASGYSATSYKIYTYVPASAFTSTATYNVTI